MIFLHDLYLRHSIQSRWASLESHETKPARDQSRDTNDLFFTINIIIFY